MNRALILLGVAGMFAACAKTDGILPPPPLDPPPLESMTIETLDELPAPSGELLIIDASQLIADFEMIGEFNNVGGKYGAWASGPPDPAGKCAVELSPEGEGGGSALRISYDITTPGSYGGIWMHLENFDASADTCLVLSVRTPDAGPDFFVELKDSAGRNVSRAKATGVGKTWTKVSLPFSAFEKIKEWNRLYELALVFDQNVSTVKKGTYIIDNIRFE